MFFTRGKRLIDAGWPVAADDGDGVVDLLALLRAVVEVGAEARLALLGGLQHGDRVLYWKVDAGRQRQAFLGWLGQLHLDVVGGVGTRRIAGGGLGRLLVAELTGVEAKTPAAALLPARGPQVGDYGGAALIGHLGDEPHVLGVALAGRAGEVVDHAAAHRRHAGAAARGDQRHLVDGPVGSQEDILAGGFGRRSGARSRQRQGTHKRAKAASKHRMHHACLFLPEKGSSKAFLLQYRNWRRFYSKSAAKCGSRR